MKIENTELPDVYWIRPQVNKGFRGNYVMIGNDDWYDNLLQTSKVKFVERDVATSRKGVFRGIHYSPNCWKIYQCLHGAIYYVFVNCDKNDKEFGRWGSFYLEPYDQLLKHPKYGAGMLALEDDTILHYAQSQYYNPSDPDQETFTWDYFNYSLDVTDSGSQFQIDVPKTKYGPIFYPNIPMILSRRDTIGEYEFKT